MKSMARNIKKKCKLSLNCSPLPETWKDMTVFNDLAKTVDGKPFLILDETVSGKQIKVWGWASPMGLSTFKAVKDIYGDSMFEVCKSTLFVQCWVLVAKSAANKVTIPCAWFLLPDKQYPTYYLVSNKLKEMEV